MESRPENPLFPNKACDSCIIYRLTLLTQNWIFFYPIARHHMDYHLVPSTASDAYTVSPKFSPEIALPARWFVFAHQIF